MTDTPPAPKVGNVVDYNGKSYKVMAFNITRDQVDIWPHPSGGVEIRVPVNDVKVSP